MSTPDVNEGVLGTGWLSYGCTDLSAAFPHGGTAFGLVGEVYLSPQTQYLVGTNMEGSVGRVFKLGGPVVVGIELLEWSNDAVAALFPQTTTVSGERVVKFTRAGAWGGEVSTLTNLVFTPKNRTHPGFVLYAALPLLELNLQMWMSARHFLSVPAVFHGRPRAADEEIGQFGVFTSLSLA